MEITASAPRSARSPMLAGAANAATRALRHFVAPVLDLAIRWYVAAVFFASGLVKAGSWDSTLALFENEYSVPVLPPELAAYLATATELSMPVFLALGLGARLAAVVLFVFNIVAASSYPDLSPAGLVQHQMWGALLLVTLVHGPGALSVDHHLHARFAR